MQYIQTGPFVGCIIRISTNQGYNYVCYYVGKHYTNAQLRQIRATRPKIRFNVTPILKVTFVLFDFRIINWTSPAVWRIWSRLKYWQGRRLSRCQNDCLYVRHSRSNKKDFDREEREMYCCCDYVRTYGTSTGTDPVFYFDAELRSLTLLVSKHFQMCDILKNDHSSHTMKVLHYSLLEMYTRFACF